MSGRVRAILGLHVIKYLNCFTVTEIENSVWQNIVFSSVMLYAIPSNQDFIILFTYYMQRLLCTLLYSLVRIEIISIADEEIILPLKRRTGGLNLVNWKNT